MTPAGEILAARIRRGGPVPFSQFMEVALYHPECGYYVTPRDPFGVEGDFYTASQLQPVFGRLIAGALRQWRLAMGEPSEFTVVEYAAGRGEMAPALSEFLYFPVDIDRGRAPEQFTGVVFANELFDALPVDVVRLSNDELSLMGVDFDGERFKWASIGPPVDLWREYVEDLTPRFGEADEVWLELPVGLDAMLERMARPVVKGGLLLIDYGYTAREILRFPRGTLMSYRRHRAIDDVLVEPGLQDITAHVPFTYLADCAARLGLTAEPLQTLARFLLRTGEVDQFAGALRVDEGEDGMKLRMQLKSLLFGLGETFRVVTLRKG